MDAMLASQVINWRLPGAGFTIYGIDTEPHMMGNQECEGLVWNSQDVAKPTEAELQAWAIEYEAHMHEQNRIANRDWVKFGQLMLADEGILSKAFQAHPNAWYLLIDLLRRPTQSLESYQLAIKLVRMTIPIDLTEADIDHLNGYATQSGIDLEVPYAYQ